MQKKTILNKSFEEYFEQIKKDKTRSYKNKEVANQDYELSKLRELFSEEIEADKFATGIRKKINEINEGILRNSGSAKIKDLGTFDYVDKKITELYKIKGLESEPTPSQEAAEHAETFEKMQKGEITTPEDLGKSIAEDHEVKQNENMLETIIKEATPLTIGDKVHFFNKNIDAFVIGTVQWTKYNDEKKTTEFLLKEHTGIYYQNEINDLTFVDKKTTEISNGVISEKSVDDWARISPEYKYSTAVKTVPYMITKSDKGLWSILGNIVSTDQLRPKFTGIHSTESGIFASDMHRLAYLNKVGDKGFFLKNKNLFETKDDLLMPISDFKFVLKNESDNVSEVDILALKTYCEIIVRAKWVNESAMVVRLLDQNGKIFGANTELLITMCEAMLRLGYKTIYFASLETKMYFCPDKECFSTGEYIGKADTFLLMQMIIKDEIFDSGTFQGDKDFNRGGNVAYDLYSNEVVTDGGRIRHKIDTSIIKSSIASTSGLSAEHFKVINPLVRKSPIPIAYYVKVKDGVLTSTNLQVTFIKTNVSLPDGLYEVLNNVLQPVDKDIEDFPEFNTQSAVKIGTINKNELTFHLEKAVPFVAKDELRPIMNCVNLRVHYDGLFITSTNAHCIYSYDIKNHTMPSDKQVNIASPNMVLLALKGFDCEDVAIYSWNEKGGYLVLECGGDKILVKDEGGVFPDYRQVFGAYSKKITIGSIAEVKSIISKTAKESKNIAFDTDNNKVLTYELSDNYGREVTTSNIKEYDVKMDGRAVEPKVFPVKLLGQMVTKNGDFSKDLFSLVLSAFDPSKPLTIFYEDFNHLCYFSQSDESTECFEGIQGVSETEDLKVVNKRAKAIKERESIPSETIKDRISRASAETTLKEVKENGYAKAADPVAVAENIKKYTGVEVYPDMEYLSVRLEPIKEEGSTTTTEPDNRQEYEDIISLYEELLKDTKKKSEKQEYTDIIELYKELLTELY